MSVFEAEFDGDSDINASFSTLAGVGVSIYPIKNISIDLGYRYTFYGIFEEELEVYGMGNYIKTETETTIDASEFYLALRFLF